MTCTDDCDELAAQLEVSKLTIRRDLQSLQEEGWIERSHGSAVPITSVGREQSYQQKGVQRNSMGEHCTVQRERSSARAPRSSWNECSLIRCSSGTNAIDTNGLMIPNETEARMEGLMIKRSESTDHTKFDERSVVGFTELADLDAFVTDQIPSDAGRQVLDDAGVTIQVGEA